MPIRSVLHGGRRVALALGLVAAVGISTAAQLPAYAGTKTTTGSSTVSTSATPDPNAPFSGKNVAGAVYGQAAVAAAGSLATDFVNSHQEMLSALKSQATTAAAQLHDWWGTFPDTGSGPGGMATQSIDPNFRLSKAGDILYAPTMKPANGSCIEVVTVHNTGVPQIWAWDWCKKIAPGAEVKVTSTFISTYTTTVNGRSAYTQKNVLTNKATNTWTSYLYNYSTKAWDKLFASSGTDQSGLSYGWDMFEFYSATNPSTGHTYVCDDIAKAGLVVQSTSVKIRSAAGSWSLANTSDSKWQPTAHPNPSSYKCPAMVFTIVANNYDWTVSEG